MNKALGAVSAAAGAIVGVVKLIGLLSGADDWLGDNWKEALGYVGVVAVILMGAIAIVGLSRPQLVGPLWSSFGPEARSLHEEMVDMIAKQRAAGSAYVIVWWVTVIGGAAVTATLAYAAAQHVSTVPVWGFGAAITGYALFAGLFLALVAVASIFDPARAKMECPYCLEKVRAVALVCAHCGQRLTRDTPTDDDEDELVWL